MLSKDFVIVGYPIAKSKSPILHNTAFAHHGLPHKYRYIETPVLDESIRQVLRSSRFGGASVTQPHKLAIRDLIDSVTPVAALLGAVNTVIPVQRVDGTVELVGDNTDCIGILRELQGRLTPEQRLGPELVGLVIGAGGAGRAAVHALHEAGMTTIYLYNRTRKTAEDLVFSFPSIYNIILIDNLSAASFEEGLPVAIVGTLPAKATCIKGDERGADQVLLPEDGLLREGGVVVCDMAYLPRETPLLRLAHRLGPNQCSTFNGLDILLQQGYEQFRLWNHLEPPVELCRKKVVEEYERENPL
ncbi:hypothetical protein JCM10207_000353 [Rhodosporidiobolus poonsookiae]